MSEHPLNSDSCLEVVIDLLGKRGVSLDDIAEIVKFLQINYVPDLTNEMCMESVGAVLKKREVQNALLTGIQLDILAEENKLLQPLQSIIEADEPLYGVDEVLALAIVNLYGSIGFTNFGYVDKLKHGKLEFLNDRRNGVHTFLDDLVGAIAAAASSRIAHRQKQQEECLEG
ncbi:phosphatidylglycerophosphatase A [Brevibacillus choshinensis]|uniref:phosphatidylglycerophosphatase A family protein n=1 Tax=Brevibacillus choshinensis TaxID=54911 RepID=UPI002E1BCBB0|nr:phosphatidylglycerophosphatase A [Brevibacillus choshinensis]MED4755215.1 phosphatidylglycerophosphatase A [Brevibacillus choshinensis]MED4784118.1 phosphatidylglycerophosphatase A [Brevibacillus choshinensis]